MEETKGGNEEHHSHESHEHESHEHESHVHKKRNDWKIFSGILGIIVIALLVVIFYGRINGTVVSGAVAGDNLIKFAKAQGVDATLVKVSEKNGLYEAVLSMNGQEVPIYVTKDGKNMAASLVPLTGSTEPECKADTDCAQGQVCQSGYCVAQPKDIPKSDKPKVELFVMAYCPYGTQSEKGLIPTIKALGSKIDAKIRFVHYFMHGDKEEQETYTQVCIREEQSSKYLDYLSCFLEAGDSPGCLTKIGIDKTKLNTCLANNSTKAKEYYKVDSDLSNKYGVQGSPTLIINGVESSAGRDSTSYLNGICAVFNSAPSECSKKLSSDTPGAGFGTTATPAASAASASTAGCASA